MVQDGRRTRTGDAESQSICTGELGEGLEEEAGVHEFVLAYCYRWVSSSLVHHSLCTVLQASEVRTHSLSINETRTLEKYCLTIVSLHCTCISFPFSLAPGNDCLGSQSEYRGWICSVAAPLWSVPSRP